MQQKADADVVAEHRSLPLFNIEHAAYDVCHAGGRGTTFCDDSHHMCLNDMCLGKDADSNGLGCPGSEKRNKKKLVAGMPRCTQVLFLCHFGFPFLSFDDVLILPCSCVFFLAVFFLSASAGLLVVFYLFITGGGRRRNRGVVG